MLVNYLKLSIRLLARNPFYTTLNVVGLAIGFTSFLALWPYATSELSVDQYHENHDRIVRIGTNWRWTEDEGKNWGLMVFGISKSTLPPKMMDDFPEVESYVRVFQQGGFFQQGLVPLGTNVITTVENKRGEKQYFKETNVAYADSNLFDFFTLPLIRGDKKTVLRESNFVALSLAASTKYFGDKDPVGELLVLNDSITLKVSGVFTDLPHNTHLSLDMVISNVGQLNAWNNAWLAQMRNYIKLREGTSITEFEKKINGQLDKYFAENLRVMTTNKFDLFVQPLADIAFSKSFTGDGFPVRSTAMLGALIGVSIVVLLMAWVNYVNLSISRFTRRMKEFAARKANGASTKDLLVQCLVESIVINAIAIVLSLTLLQIVRHPVHHFLGIKFSELSSMNPATMALLGALIACGILVTGIYPVWMSMSNNPRTLFQLNAQPAARQRVPAILTTAQFTAAVSLIAWGVIVFAQLNLILHKEVGLNREGVVVVESPTRVSNNYQQHIDVFVDQIGRDPDVLGVCAAWRMIGDFSPGGGSLRNIGTETSFGMDANAVDEAFIPFFSMKMLAGRNFRTDERKDAVIISRVALNRLGFANSEEAIGSKLEATLDGMEGTRVVEVVGVIEDYRLEPYFNADESHSQYANGGEGRGILLTYKNKLSEPLTSQKMAIRVDADRLEEVIPNLEATFNTRFPGEIFIWYFLDDHINRIYSSEKITRNQILLLTILSIVIACLGLVGSMANRINEKTKEIGIRKIHGAGMWPLSTILLRAFIRQFGVAILLGIPVAIILSDQYIQKYSERIALSWTYFALPVLAFLVASMASIITMLWKAAKRNPVESLKYE
jgi:putative ABC transport system permease protein